MISIETLGTNFDEILIQIQGKKIFPENVCKMLAIFIWSQCVNPLISIKNGCHMAFIEPMHSIKLNPYFY